MRSLPEWIGKNDNSAVPPRVSLRILEAYGHCCYLSRQPINDGDEWQVEHVLAIALGGANRESNLAPVLIAPHKAKTRQDIKAKAKIARIKKKRFKLAKAKTRPMPGTKASGWRHKMNGQWERRP